MASFYEELRKVDLISDEKENEQSRGNIDKWIFRLLLLLIGIVPLAVLASVEEVLSPLISNIDLLSSGTKGELFTHYKSILLLSFTVIICIMFLIKIFFMDGQILKTSLNYVLLVFAIAIIISTIFSSNTTVALNGQYNRSEGALSWLCYICLIFVSMNISYPKKALNHVLYALMPFVYINLIIITMNFYNKDLLQYSWIQKMISVVLPSGASLGEGSQLVGTLNQWNYMSGMFAIMTILYLSWAITSKNWTELLIGTITASASVLIMFMALSTSGFLTLIALLVIIVLLIFKLEDKKFSLVSLVLFLLITSPMFYFLSKENKSIVDESFGFIVKNNHNINYNVNLSSKVYASENIIELPTLPDRGGSAGSGRIYIWEKSIELIKEKPFWGYGLDTYMYNFPHYNLDARSGNWDENIIVDKPHNTYLGIQYGVGIFGLLAFISILYQLLKGTITMLFVSYNRMIVLALAGLAYFIQAVFNDSLQGISVVVFVMIGIFFAHLSVSNKDKGAIIE